MTYDDMDKIIKDMMRLEKSLSQIADGLKQLAWKSVSELPPDESMVLAVCRTKPGIIYNCMASGWWRDEIYSCRYHRGCFDVLPIGVGLNFKPTHWCYQMELPE